MQLDLPDLPAVSLAQNGRAIRNSVFADASTRCFGSNDVRLAFDGHAGSGDVEFVEIDADCNLIISRCYWKQAGALRYRGEGWVRFNFCMDANATFVFGEHGAYDLKGTELRVFRQPEGIDCDHLIRPDARSVCVTLSLRPERLRQRLDDLPALRATCLGSPADHFFFERFWQGAETIRAVRDLLNIPYEGELRVPYIRAKTEEMLCAAFSIMLDKTPPLSVVMREPDWSRVEEARAIIERDVTDVPPVPRLARMVGLNRNKLAYGFRHRYNETVSEFIASQRLEFAWQLLQSHGLTVSQVAETVGYAHAASFTSAFKARFGLLPKQVAQSARSRS